MHGNEESNVLRATRLYSQALRMLQERIEDPVNCHHHTTVCAAMALNFYEVIGWSI
jgi:hypothetical protein